MKTILAIKKLYEKVNSCGNLRKLSEYDHIAYLFPRHDELCKVYNSNDLTDIKSLAETLYSVIKDIAPKNLSYREFKARKLNL